MKQFLLVMFTLLTALFAQSQSITEVYLPQYVQGVGSGNPPDDRKVPFVCRLTVNGLTPNATYRYYPLFGSAPTGSTGNGAYIIANQTGNFARVTSPTLAIAGRFGQFTTDGSGSVTDWFIIEPSSSTAFTPGVDLYVRLFLNNGAGGTAVVTRVTAPSPVRVINWAASAGASNGSGIRAANPAAYTPKNFVLMWDNVAGTGRPISGTYVEGDGVRQLSALNADPTNEGYAPFYGDVVDGVDGSWGAILPNTLPNGIRNISQFSLQNGSLVNLCTDAAGNFGANTVNPTNGLTPLVITCTPTNPPLGATASVINVNCFGDATGTINVTANAGTPPYSYEITAGPVLRPAQASNSFANLPAGSYTVTVTDGAAGSTTVSATITQPAAALSGSGVAGNILCFGGTASITVTGAGGTAPYSFVIPSGPVTNTTGATSGVFTGLTAGDYTFTLTDNKGCTFTTGTVTIAAAPAAVTATLPGAGNPIITTPGGTTTLTVVGGGGTPGYTYSLSPAGNTTGDVTGIYTGVAAGTYTVTVTDANGCTATANRTIAAVNPLVVTVTPSSPSLNCAGVTTVTIAATGGVTPYVSGTGVRTLNASGSYTFTVFDSQGNSASQTITVAAATGCPQITEVQLPKYIQGVGSGNPLDDVKVPYAARLTITGLAANTTYRYYSLLTPNPAVSANEVGAYTIANKTGNFTRVTAPTLAIAGRYGTFTTNAQGAVTDWFIVEASSASEFTPGNQVYLRILLNNGSTGTTVANRVTASSPITVLNFGAGASNGSALRSNVTSGYTAKNFVLLYDNINGTGRPEAGTFIESDGVLNDKIGPDGSGFEFGAGYAPFYGDVVDGTTQWGTIIPNTLGTGIRNITQYALADGAFVNKCTAANGVFGTANTVNPTTGLTAQVIECSPFATTFAADPALGQMDITTLGDVSVPAAGLMFTQNYKLKIPFYNLNQVNTVPNGTIKVTVNLGANLELATGFDLVNAPLSNYFDWTSAIVGGNRVITGTQKADIPEDLASTLVFNVRGIISCSSIINANIEIVNILNVLVDDDLNNNNSSLNYNLPVTVTTTQVNVLCNGESNGIINISTSPLAVGSTIVTRNAANTIVGTTTVTTAGATTAVVNGLVPGVYTVTVTTSGLIPATCSNATTVTIVQPAVLTSTVSSVVNNLCNGGNVGGFTVTGAGGTSPYSYAIAGPTVNTSGASTGVFTGLTAGVYTITITDANNCTATNTATIGQPTGTAPDITLGADVSGSLFATTGATKTIVYNVAEIAGNAAVGDTIRITRVSGFTINFNNTSFTATVGGTTYTLDNARWKIDNSNPAFVSIILTDPLNAANPGTLQCLERVFVAITLTRNTPNISTFTLSSRLRRANNELNLGNQLNSIIFAAE